ncbi:MAG: helix-hairpin-helix domain-containing protein [Planctomycetaceae bacterium]|jgi:uncharacterized protein|nr:helix-hairpin-helix domain-containing protein [Planctomycetaceae bacterium]
MVEPVTINLRFLARDLGLPQEQVQSVVTLLDDGFPVPFIARYRKDQTGNLDEEILRNIEEELHAVRALCERKQAILKTIDSQGKLTPELDKKIRDAKSLRRLEDLYLPFKPKRQTLATEAREHGLEPLALEIFHGTIAPEKLDQRASEFINEDKKIKSIADALLGAGYIIAETFSEKIEVVQYVRESIYKYGKLVTSKIEPKIPTASVLSKNSEISGNSEKSEKPEKPEKKSAAKKTKKEKNSPKTTDDTETKTQNNDQNDQNVAVSSEIPKEPEHVDVTENAENIVSADSSEKTETEHADTKTEITTEPTTEPTTETETNTASETMTAENVENAVVAEPQNVEPQEIDPQNADVLTVTEQFKQWKTMQEIQGIPVVRSQNSLKKKKTEEIQKQKEDAKNKHQEYFERQFSDYFDFTAGLRNFPAHRILAINRGERGKVIRVKIDHNEAKTFDIVREFCIPKDHPHVDFLAGCLKDALHRLVIPSIEREIRNDMTEFAEKQAIRVFGKNLRHLLLQPPLHRKRVLALDPGYKHGCKMVPLDEFGNVLDFETVYLSGSPERKEKAVQKIADIIQKYKISVIAIGNGSGSRETEEVVSGMIAARFADSELAYVIVNEAGASVYSASPVAKEEFPDYDPLLRGAVSIGRRLQDPLNELVKIDPASLGVGMYQHDLKNKHLKNMLTDVVESCVNFAGVDLNTATSAILRYVSGLNQMTAKRIHEYRLSHGPYRSREEIKKVSGLGEVAFTHAAGFLKIHDGTNPLDATWIHPESYHLAAKILEKLGFSVDDLKNNEKIKEIAAKIAEEKIGELSSKLSSELGVGLFTVRDTLDSLARPGRDPRESLPPPVFKKGILHAEDLKHGMELTGTVLNVVDFGAFVDIGLHDSGLIHISQMADQFIRDTHEKVAVGDIVRVWVVEADLKRKRISLTMLPPGTEKQPKPEHSAAATTTEPRRQLRWNESREQNSKPSSSTEEKKSTKHFPEHEHRERQQPENRRPPKKTTPQTEHSTNDPAKQRSDDQHPLRRDNRNNRDRDRYRRERDNREHGNREHGNRNRVKTYVASPKTKELKPISEKMKQGKEALRSFGDLAQFLGHVQIADPAEEKKRKKEEARSKKKEQENS